MHKTDNKADLKTVISVLSEGDRAIVNAAIKDDRDLAGYLDRLLAGIPYAAAVDFLFSLASYVRRLPAGRDPVTAVLPAYAQTMRILSRKATLN